MCTAAVFVHVAGGINIIIASFSMVLQTASKVLREMLRFRANPAVQIQFSGSLTTFGQRQSDSLSMMICLMQAFN